MILCLTQVAFTNSHLSPNSLISSQPQAVILLLPTHTHTHTHLRHPGFNVSVIIWCFSEIKLTYYCEKLSHSVNLFQRTETGVMATDEGFGGGGSLPAGHVSDMISFVDP